MKKQYFITDEIMRNAVKSFTKNMMKGQKNWRKDSDLDLLEYQIEGIIQKHLSGFGGIKFEN